MVVIMVLHKPPWHLRMLVVLIVMMLPAFGNNDSKGDCQVGKSLRMNLQGAAPLPVLAYVSRSTNVTLGFFFRGVDAEQERDAVCLNSTGATHSVVRGGEETWTPVGLPRLIPEGWNTLTVAVDEQNVTVTLVQGPDQLTLLTLLLLSSVTTVLAKGTVARCPTPSPEWEVTAGNEIEVILQPGGSKHDQWVKVSGGGLEAAAPYLSFPSSPNAMSPVPGNTILRITSSLRGDHALLKVFKDGDGSGEEVVEGRVSITAPLIMLVRNGGGDGDDGGDGDGPSIHLRLMLSSPLMYDAASATNTSSGAGGLVPTAIGVSLAVLVLVFFLVGGVVLYWWRQREKRYRHLRKEQSVATVTPQTVASLSRRLEFEGRLIHTTTNGVQSLRLHLLPDLHTAQLLSTLHKIDISKVELLLASVPEASQLHTFNERLTALPDIQKVKLEVADFKEKDLDKVCELVMKLQPSHGYAIIDFRGDISSSSGDGEVLSEEAWEKLLRSLDERKVKVKGKVWLPAGAVTEERRKLLPHSFTYDCGSANMTP